MPELILPGGSDRTVVIGGTGTGKTILAAFILSKQRWEERPWVIIEFKDEPIWNKVGEPPIIPLTLNKLPTKKRGLFKLSVFPGQEEELEEWLWKVWRHENIGLFCDEVSLLDSKNAFKAILRQGRSKRIPVIGCTQRPVDCDREIFTESQYIVVFPGLDERDLKTVKGFTRKAPIERPLKEHWSYWYDKKRNATIVLQPVPPPDSIAASIKAAVPYTFNFWGR